jgi:hypothetical protein
MPKGQPTGPTKVLNLRGVPMPLYTALKVLAAQANMGIRDYCVAVLNAHVAAQEHRRTSVRRPA